MLEERKNQLLLNEGIEKLNTSLNEVDQDAFSKISARGVDFRIN